MKKDGRSHDHKTLEFIRKNALARIHAGESASAVMESFGFCRTTEFPPVSWTAFQASNRS